MPKPFQPDAQGALQRSLIEYEISLQDITSHDPSHLRTVFQTLGTAKGGVLAALSGCWNITVDEQIPNQPFNHPDVRAYAQVLAETPLGLAFFLRPDSTSLPMLAYATTTKVKTSDNSKTGDIVVTANTDDLIDFLSSDLSVAEKLFKRAGMGADAFEECVRRINRLFNLRPEDWK